MSDESKNPSADDLAKTKKPGDIQLTEEDLAQVTGGDSTTTTSSKAGRTNLNDITITKIVDKVSPL